jgi:hypothetical protein
MIQPVFFLAFTAEEKETDSRNKVQYLHKNLLVGFE